MGAGHKQGDGVHLLATGTNHMRTIMSAAALAMLIASPAEAVRPDECEQQRALFPKQWNDVSKEKPLFFCWSHYSGALKITLGAAEDKGRCLMSLCPARAQRCQSQTRYLEGRFSHLAGQGTDPTAARRKVFCDRGPTKGILLDSRSAFQAGRRQRGFRLLPGWRKSQIRQPRRGFVLQQGSALQRVSGRLLRL